MRGSESGTPSEHNYMGDIINALGRASSEKSSMAQSATPKDLPSVVAMGSSCSDTRSPIAEIARLMRSITAAACTKPTVTRITERNGATIFLWTGSRAWCARDLEAQNPGECLDTAVIVVHDRPITDSRYEQLTL